MNKIKKIIISIVIAIIALLGICTNAKASYTDADLYVGNTISINFNDFASDSNILCAQKSQPIRVSYPGRYLVTSKISIVGDVSSDGSKQVKDKRNAELAYILGQPRGGGISAGVSTNNYPAMQHAFWRVFADWCVTIGTQHGIDSGFATKEALGSKGQDINNAAKAYAERVANGVTTEIKDNTRKESIRISTFENNGKTYARIGPFNWSFGGSLTGVTVKNQDKGAIGNVLYNTFEGSETAVKWLKENEIPSGTDFYICVPVEGNNEITEVTAKGKNTSSVYAGDIWFLKSINTVPRPSDGKRVPPQNLVIKRFGNQPTEFDFENSFDYPIPLVGNIKLIKVDKYNKEFKLQGVGFQVEYANTGKFIHQAANGTITYVERKDATEFFTNENGEIFIPGVLLGNYKAYETTIPQYGYEVPEEPIEVVLDTAGGTKTFQIENEQIYVKLSGYVWLDKIDGKTSARNDLFKTADGNSSDVNDVLLNGITVRLMDKRKTGADAIVKTAKTANLGRYQDSGNDGNGEYLFEDVLIEDLENYYIEFEYDGLTYTNVIPHINQDRGSKAAESTQERENFNQNFTAVEGESRNSGFTRDANGNRKYDLVYNVNEEKHEATLVNSAINETPKYPITANTDVTQYNMRGHFEYGQEEVRYINLGIYEREQPDIGVIKDLSNVKVTVNGYEHTYQYSQRFLHEDEYNKDGGFFNVGVRFGSKYTASYRRPIYEADYLYVNEQDKSKELKVYATYEIRMRNKSSSLSTRINSLVDYYDARYNIVDIGTAVNERGNIEENSKVDYVKDENYNNNGYKKVIINTNQKLDKEAGKDESKIFVQVELNREAVINVLNGKANLENVVEINSYSIYDKAGKIYAGIDKNSNPGNCVPGDKKTYEDDTDSSPDLILEPADARQMGGKVFLDETSGNLMTGEIRQGSGKYEDGEHGIEGVDITLTETTGSGKIYRAKTDANGDFLIEDYIPGDYTLTYTWGDQTYTVQRYKGTVYDRNRDQNNKKWWYQADGEAVVRYTDAIDDYEERQRIDQELMNLKANSPITKTKMNSTTPIMGIGVEYESVYTASMGDKYTYKIDNIDFGIVERPRQEISLDKRVKTLKATMANGQVLVNLTVEEDENGNRVITGDRSNVTYMKPDANINPENGFIRLELDNELIQGCIIEVGYEIKATNLSELDYLSENFYKYGIVEGNKVTIEPTAIIDYLDNQWAFDQNKNPQWSIKTIDDLKNIVATTVYNNEQTTLGEKIVLYTEALKGRYLAPTESASVILNVSKVLTTTDEISLDNETEIVEINKTGGSKPLQSTPGNYVPGAGKTEMDDDMAETTIVTPATGENRDYIGYIALTISSLGILVAGVIFIKKKILK